MYRKPLSVCGMYWTIDRPRPAPKSCALVIDKRLAKARLVIHHKRTLLHNWLANRATLKHEAIRIARGLKSCGIG